MNVALYPLSIGQSATLIPNGPGGRGPRDRQKAPALSLGWQDGTRGNGGAVDHLTALRQARDDRNCRA